jgi:hypothetical protein
MPVPSNFGSHSPARCMTLCPDALPWQACAHFTQNPSHRATKLGLCVKFLPQFSPSPVITKLPQYQVTPVFTSTKLPHFLPSYPTFYQVTPVFTQSPSLHRLHRAPATKVAHESPLAPPATSSPSSCSSFIAWAPGRR